MRAKEIRDREAKKTWLKEQIDQHSLVPLMLTEVEREAAIDLLPFGQAFVLDWYPTDESLTPILEKVRALNVRGVYWMWESRQEDGVSFRVETETDLIKLKLSIKAVRSFRL